MAKQDIDIGVEGNDGTGDSIRESFRKVNENFNELYAVFGAGGQISFTNLGDTPNALLPRRTVLVNDAATALDLVEFASDSASDPLLDDSIQISYDIAGKIILSTSFRALSQDLSPTLGAPLDATGGTEEQPVSIALGPYSITQEAVNEFNKIHTGDDITIDDLAITKGYADNRYIAGDLPIRIDDEPVDDSEYNLIIQSYTDGNLFIPDHGFDRTVNGTPFVFQAEDTDPSNLVSDTTYYLRYATSNSLSVHRTPEDASVQSQAAADANRIFITHTIAVDDEHKFVDAAYDDDLEGFFLSNEAMPRKSIVRRQGDKMTGPLVLHDSPGELAGLTNNPEDLQAATKFYVDNTAYSSPTNLFVSTSGDDTMNGVPAGKEGTSWSYAYSSIKAAAQRAEEIMKASEAEPGPYFQTITRDNGAAPAEVISATINNPLFATARSLIEENREFVIREITAYLNFTYPDFEYNVQTCERDLGLILDAISIDINRSQSLTVATANSLTRIAAERYYASSSGKLAITRQLTETVDAIETARDIVSAILLNRPFQQTVVSNITQSSIGRLTTSTSHGLQDSNIIVVKSVTGMTQVNDNFYYVKVIDNTTLELFQNEELTLPVDTSQFTGYSSGGIIGLVYQTDNKQFFGGSSAGAVERQAIVDKFNLITNILQNGIDAGANVVYGKTYKVVVNNGGLNATDQGNVNNRDVLPGKILVGKISGAQGRIVSYTQNSVTDNGQDVIELHLTKAADFIPGEDLEYGNFVNRNQVTIFIESGQYEEDYPIKVAANVSLKGDEFRRVIIRPKNRVSQSPWASTYIYRDREFDGINVADSGARFYNQTNEWQGHFGYHYLTNPEKDVNTGISVINAGGFDTAANILKENKEFIQEEVINYINNNFKDLLYDKSQFRDDLEDILTGLTYDITLGTTYNQTLYGLRFQRAKSIYLDDYLKELWVVGLAEAKRIVSGLPAVIGDADALSRANDFFDEVVNIIENGVVDTDTAASAVVYGTISSTVLNENRAKLQLQNNREFIAQEGLAYIKNIAPKKYIDDNIRLRDYRNLVDALSYDIVYGGNFGTTEFAKDLFIDNVLRFEITTRQESLETFEHLSTVISDIVQGVSVTPTAGNEESQSTVGGVATGTEATKLDAYIQIINDQINNNNLLSLPTSVFPSLLGSEATLIDAKVGIDGALSTIQNSVISEIDDVALFTYNQNKCRRDVGLIVDALAEDLENGSDEFSTEVQGEYYESYISQYNNNGFGGQENVTKGAIEYIATIADRLFDSAYDNGLLEQNPLSNDFIEPDFKFGTAEIGTDAIVNNLVDKIVFAFNRQYNPPKRNDEMDVFLMNDATILRNITVQGHGGFLCVLDPAGQILTKSPYVQTGSSFSKSINEKIFGGGMFVDAYAGNLPAYIPTTIDVGDGPESGKINDFTLWIRSEEGQGLFIRPPELPCPFYIEGRRYQVNAISDYDQSNGWCKIYLDTNSNSGNGYDETQFEEDAGQISRGLYLQTAGNRSMLGNDFTQINDLGYGLVTTNGAFSEMVSMFTYYCQAAYYAKNGSEIRSLNGSNGYGNFGLVAEGADPNEIPDQVTYEEDMTYPVKTLTFLNGGENTNLADQASIFITDARYPPQPNSIIVVDHGGSIGVLRYRISAVNIDETTTTTGGVYSDVIYRLQIQGAPDGENGDFFGNLQEDIPDGSYVEYRSSETHKFDGVKDQAALVTRPSTAINFDESDDITYRSISFSNSDSYGDDLDANSIITTFEIPYDVIELPVDFPNVGGGNGGAIGDTTIAIRTDDETGFALDTTEIIRLTRDVAGKQPGDPGYTGGMIFSYAGRTHQIIGFTDGGDGSATIDIASTPVTDITAGGTGIAQAFTENRVLYAGLPADTTAEITIAISLCRATGHDFTQIGTGSFNDSNYPNVILGAPEKSLAPYYSDSPNATSAQVWERRKGRVFWMSTDQFGFFRVGKFFEVDQGQGSIKFSGEIGITGANALGFKKGVTIDEFSIDDTMADESDTSVPVEKAIVGYINKRLGVDKNDSEVGGRIGPGFLPLSGSVEMEGDIQMGSNNITNLATPNNNSDASTKGYVDNKALEFDNIDALRNISSNRTEGSDILVYTGLKKVLTTVPADSSGSEVFEAGDEITDVSGNKSAIVRDIVQTTDDIVGELQPGNNIWIIVYELQEVSPGVLSADFNTAEDIEGVGLKSSVSANILRGPFEEIAHAREADDSVINVTVTRTQGVTAGSLTDPIAEINLQIENDTIINADINSSASIVQSKLLMERATPRTSSSGLYGTGDDTGQSNRGLAVFDGDHFTHEIQVQLTNPITASAGDFIYQSTSKGTVVNSVANSSVIILRTSDTYTPGPTVLELAEVDANGVERAKQTQVGVTVSNVNASGYIGIKDRSIGFDKLRTIDTDTVLGRSNPATGDIDEIPFSTIIDQGFGLQDIDFANSEISKLSGQRLEFASPVNAVDGETVTQNQDGGIVVTGTVQGSVVSETFVTVVDVENAGGDPASFNTAAAIVGSTSSTIGTPIAVAINESLVGAALVKQADGVYGTTNISTVSANDTIARRSATGAIQANSYIIGGSSSNEILTESGGTLTFKTPGGGTILTSNGTGSPTVNIPGNIDNGGTSVTESTFQAGSDSADEAFVSTNWIYAPFIEAPGERDAGSTGISVGDGTGFASSAADTLILVTNGNERVVVNNATTKVNNNLNVNDNFTVTASNGNVAFEGSLTLGGGITMNTDKFTVTTAGIVGIASTLTVGGTANLNGNVELGNAGTDSISFNGSVDTSILPSGSRNIGSASAVWNTVYATTFSGTATTARYADLAENYLADADYEPGTVVVFGGDHEVTVGDKKGDHRVAGVISTNPAHLMNSDLEGENVIAVALSGRVPCKVLGQVHKGDLLVSSAVPGYAIVDNNPKVGTVIGKAIADKDDDGKGVVEVLVGKS